MNPGPPTYKVGPLDVPAVDEGEEEEAGRGQEPLSLVRWLTLGEEGLQGGTQRGNGVVICKPAWQHCGR